MKFIHEKSYVERMKNWDNLKVHTNGLDGLVVWMFPVNSVQFEIVKNFLWNCFRRCISNKICFKKFSLVWKRKANQVFLIFFSGPFQGGRN